MTDTILHFDKVVKTFGSVHAVKALTASIAAGERVVLVGHNGAGKTTLFKMVLGLSAVSAGSIKLFGVEPGSLEARRMTAYLPENVAFSGTLTGRETLAFYCRLRGEPVRCIDGLLDRVGLADAAGRAVRTYSKGMRQRLGLAQALIGSPRLLVLDEPTSGLDPASRKTFYDIVDRCAADGMTILMSSHALSEMEPHADRILVMRDGELVADGSLAALRRQTRLPIRIRVQTNTPAAIARLAEGFENVRGDDSAESSGMRRINGHGVELTCMPDDLAGHMGRLAALGSEIADVEIQPPGLDQIYLHLAQQTRSEGRQ